MHSSRHRPDAFLHRDLSWLAFNERVLDEARRQTVPLMERIKFLAIYSSNLDEFYRVRMPALAALNKLSATSSMQASGKVLDKINKTVLRQQRHFGRIFEKMILPELRSRNIRLYYNEPLPGNSHVLISNYFLNSVAAYIQVVDLMAAGEFFPENNKLYLFVQTQRAGRSPRYYIVNVPSDNISRFYTFLSGSRRHILMLDDIVKHCLPHLFPKQKVIASNSFKITRDAELNLEDEYVGNLARKIESKILRRDYGVATRFLYQPGIDKPELILLRERLNLGSAYFIKGGTYHNLKDLTSLPVDDQSFCYPHRPGVKIEMDPAESIFQRISRGDIMIHLPYHTYDPVLRFFNEAAFDPSVTRIYITLYRVASNSQIVNALITAARNGKKVTVFVELKARFDEANNIRWSKQMKMAGVRIIESIPGLKVHAKVALVKRKTGKKVNLFGLFSTGNFNETTARFYTDHILMTSHWPMVSEAEQLFIYLKKQKKKAQVARPQFRHLLVGLFNLQPRFLELIDREISHARAGRQAVITIKFNNLEDRVMIKKLYDASRAGVVINLIIRGICCLVPGVTGMSEQISVRRIVDQYLEHGRIFIFHNDGNPEIYLGSADWMIRNLYRRIEVCFPIYDEALKSMLTRIVDLQLHDNVQAVVLDKQGNNILPELGPGQQSLRSQEAINALLVSIVNRKR
jgi:polyphosphate kinase